MNYRTDNRLGLVSLLCMSLFVIVTGDDWVDIAAGIVMLLCAVLFAFCPYVAPTKKSLLARLLKLTPSGHTAILAGTAAMSFLSLVAAIVVRVRGL